MGEEKLDAGAALELGRILRAVGEEVADLGKMACGLQESLSPSEFGPGWGRAALDRLQALDILTQRLDGIAGFLHALAPTLPADWLCDATRAAEAMTLADLARRLTCANPNTLSEPSGAAGELELFEA